MKTINLRIIYFIGIISLLSFTSFVFAGEQPVAIFHAFDQAYDDIGTYVCDLPNQGYSHIQIAPAQKSNPDKHWWARYQPVDYNVIEGMGNEIALKKLIEQAHGCGMKVIADVVFNHMANMEEYKELNFPGLSKGDFHSPCDINYNDGNRDSEVDCWLGGLPDLNHEKKVVQDIQKSHLKKLLNLGIDGFRFDAAKHMPPNVVKNYIDFIDKESNGKSWNYLEVIEDDDTSAEDYKWIAAVSDFVLYKSLLKAFTIGGDLRTLKVPAVVADPKSVTFGRNHDTVPSNNANCIMGCYGDASDSYLATAYVLARGQGTPLVLNWDNYDSPYIRYGVKFRQIMNQRAKAGDVIKENVLGVIDNPNVMVMERGSQGFFLVNKGTDRFDVPVLDMTLTSLEGCYRELRRNFTVAIERRNDGKKYVTQWGRWTRGGVEIYGREALYFIREPWEQCSTK